jgi:hypothetical protein
VRAVGHRIPVVMDMREYAPPVAKERGDDRRADASASPGHDCGFFEVRHGEQRSDEAIQPAQGWIASPPSQ